MKAVVYEQYGSADVLQIKEIEKPIPRMDQVLIKVLASSVTAADWRMRRADPFLARLFNGLLRPKKVNVLGIEISGIIEEVGKDVKSFQKEIWFLPCVDSNLEDMLNIIVYLKLLL